jgi:hypothetical protein
VQAYLAQRIDVLVGLHGEGVLLGLGRLVHHLVRHREAALGRLRGRVDLFLHAPHVHKNLHQIDNEPSSADAITTECNLLNVGLLLLEVLDNVHDAVDVDLAVDALGQLVQLVQNLR